jgi:hypothetical protein
MPMISYSFFCQTVETTGISAPSAAIPPCRGFRREYMRRGGPTAHFFKVGGIQIPPHEGLLKSEYRSNDDRSPWGDGKQLLISGDVGCPQGTADGFFMIRLWQFPVDNLAKWRRLRGRKKGG